MWPLGLGKKLHPFLARHLTHSTFFLSSFSSSLSLAPASLQAFLLQTVDGKHQDLKYISTETVCADELFAMNLC